MALVLCRPDAESEGAMIELALWIIAALLAFIANRLREIHSTLKQMKGEK